MPEIPTAGSLGVILVVLVIVTLPSLIKTRGDPTLTAHAGSLRAARTSHAEEHTPAGKE